MDAAQFDGLVRKLQSTSTRRLTLGTLATLGLGALLGENAQKAFGKKKGGGKGKGKGGGKGKGKKKNPPEGIGECINFNLHSGCRNVPGNPCCFNGNCQVCSPTDNCGCAADQRCCDGACKKGNCCTDADCPNSPFHSCSKGSEDNACV